MLLSIFSYNGKDYRGNKIPASYRQLVDAAIKIREIQVGSELSNSDSSNEDDESQSFRFTFLIPEFMTEPQSI